MKKTIQKTLTGEPLQKKAPAITMKDMIWLPTKYLLSKANLQRLLFIFSFLTYGIGDGVTSAYMIEKMGVMNEVNPVIRFFYISYGMRGVIGIKIWFTLLILFLVWIVSIRTESYWSINGFLSALCVGGIMAAWANLMAFYGMEPPSPGSITMTFLTLTVLFVLIGEVMDKLEPASFTRIPSVQRVTSRPLP